MTLAQTAEDFKAAFRAHFADIFRCDFQRESSVGPVALKSNIIVIRTWSRRLIRVAARLSNSRFAPGGRRRSAASSFSRGGDACSARQLTLNPGSRRIRGVRRGSALSANSVACSAARHHVRPVAESPDGPAQGPRDGAGGLAVARPSRFMPRALLGLRLSRRSLGAACGASPPRAAIPPLGRVAVRGCRPGSCRLREEFRNVGRGSRRRGD